MQTPLYHTVTPAEPLRLGLPFGFGALVAGDNTSATAVLLKKVLQRQKKRYDLIRV